ncbi:hypothetical protein NHJ13734_008769, partial [Beauveria thailandica]
MAPSRGSGSRASAHASREARLKEQHASKN